MRCLSGALFMLILAFSLISCGGSENLGSVGAEPITAVEYLAVFNNLPPDNQVAVLEPGGRMLLMDKIIRKRLLLTAWAANPSISSEMEELYATSMLADSMLQKIGIGFDPELYLDSISNCGYSEFSLRVVLLGDSMDAVQIAEQWDSDIYETVITSENAPWSLADGSSYRVFGGSIDKITPAFFPLLDMELGKAHVLPMFGKWCVGSLVLQEGEFIPDESFANISFMNKIAAIADVQILADGVNELASNFAISGTHLLPITEGNSEPVIIYGDETLSVADIMNIMAKTNPNVFPGEISDELLVFSSPEVFMTKESTIWFYVKALAQRYRLAQLASEHGIVLADELLDYARAESVVLNRVYAESAPDSIEVAEWYSEKSELFRIPERRSVFLAYTDTTFSSETESCSAFSDLLSLQTVLDSEGNLVPTPLQLELAFGEELGNAIFMADSGVFSGPVSLDGELDAWFEVLEIAEPQIATLEQVFPQAEVMAASAKFSEEFENLLNDLTVEYSVIIDTSAVINIDLWGSGQ